MVTMSDVARVAAVSMSTVSHVLNGTRAVNAETRERVQQAIAATGYRRNALARSLARRETTTVGIVISSLTNVYFGPLVAAMNEAFEVAGYTTLLGDNSDDPEREREVVGRMLDHQVAGLVLAPAGGAAGGAADAVQSGTPVVAVDRRLELEVDQVTPLNREPVVHLTTHLARRGLRRIAAVTGRRGLDTTEERLRGYREAIGANGLPDDPRLVVCGDSDTAEAYRVTRQLFAGTDRPDGVVVMNNAMTIGVLRALRDLHISVPEEVALVCYDDFEWADVFTPGLTAMHQEIMVMAERVVELLLARMTDPTRPAVAERIEPSFVHRDSCGCYH